MVRMKWKKFKHEFVVSTPSREDYTNVLNSINEIDISFRYYPSQCYSDECNEYRSAIVLSFKTNEDMVQAKLLM